MEGNTEAYSQCCIGALRLAESPNTESSAIVSLDGSLIARCCSVKDAERLVQCVNGMTLIHSVLTNNHQWSADTLDEIAEILEKNGFPLKSVPAEEGKFTACQPDELKGRWHVKTL
jgi:hypothetical protein